MSIPSCWACEITHPKIMSHSEKEPSEEPEKSLKMALSFVKDYWSDISAVPSLRGKIQHPPTTEQELSILFQTVHDQLNKVSHEPLKEIKHQNPYCIELLQQEYQCLEKVEIKNFSKINENLFRSGELSFEGIPKLHEKGIKTIVSITESQKDTLIEGIEAFNCVHLEFSPYLNEGLFEDKLVDFLRIIKNGEYPLLFHCTHGVDRTGLMCAAYRMVTESWSLGNALEEMDNFSTENPSFYTKYQNYLSQMNVEAIRKKLEQ